MTKVAFSADYHFGKKNNSEYHNKKLLEFIQMKIDYCIENHIEHMIICGDYFDNRQKIDVKTLHYGIQGMKMLHDQSVADVSVVIGNHDLYHRDRLDIASTDVIEPYCDLIKEETIKNIDDYKVQLVPWICDGEHWDRVVKQSKDAEYCFGHFEFNGFRMNSHYVMEHGQSYKELKHLNRVITGHFHHRQLIDNVIYVGSPFPFDFGDSDDNQRGFGVIDLETNEVEFIDCNLSAIMTVDYKDLLEGKYDQQLSDDNTDIRVTFSEEVDNDVLVEVQSKLEQSSVRQSKIEYKPKKIKDYIEGDVEIEEIEDIDQMVLKYLEKSNEVEGYNKELLTEQYKEAMRYNDSI